MAPPSAPIPAPFSLVDNGVEQPEFTPTTRIATTMKSPFLLFMMPPFYLAQVRTDGGWGNAMHIPYLPGDKPTAN